MGSPWYHTPAELQSEDLAGIGLVLAQECSQVWLVEGVHATPALVLLVPASVPTSLEGSHCKIPREGQVEGEGDGDGEGERDSTLNFCVSSDLSGGFDDPGSVGKDPE